MFCMMFPSTDFIPHRIHSLLTIFITSLSTLLTLITILTISLRSLLTLTFLLLSGYLLFHRINILRH